MKERFDHRPTLKYKRLKVYAYSLVVLNVLVNLTIVLPILVELLGEPPEGDEIILSGGLIVLAFTALFTVAEFLYHRKWVKQVIRWYLLCYILILFVFGLILTIQSWILLVVLIMLTYISIRMVILNKEIKSLWLIIMTLNLILSALMMSLL